MREGWKGDVGEIEMGGNAERGGTWKLKQEVLPQPIYRGQDAGFCRSEGTVKSEAGVY